MYGHGQLGAGSKIESEFCAFGYSYPGDPFRSLDPSIMTWVTQCQVHTFFVSYWGRSHVCLLSGRFARMRAAGVHTLYQPSSNISLTTHLSQLTHGFQHASLSLQGSSLRTTI